MVYGPRVLHSDQVTCLSYFVVQEILRSGLNTGKVLHIGRISLGGLQGIFQEKNS